MASTSSITQAWDWHSGTTSIRRGSSRVQFRIHSSVECVGKVQTIRHSTVADQLERSTCNAESTGLGPPLMRSQHRPTEYIGTLSKFFQQNSYAPSTFH